jgi:hypothetical protein
MTPKLCDLWRPSRGNKPLCRDGVPNQSASADEITQPFCKNDKFNSESQIPLAQNHRLVDSATA